MVTVIIKGLSDRRAYEVAQHLQHEFNDECEVMISYKNGADQNTPRFDRARIANRKKTGKKPELVDLIYTVWPIGHEANIYSIHDAVRDAGFSVSSLGNVFYRLTHKLKTFQHVSTGVYLRVK